MDYWPDDRIEKITYGATDRIGKITYGSTEAYSEFPWKYSWEYVPNKAIKISPGWREIDINSDGEVTINIPIDATIIGNKFSSYTLLNSGLSIEEEFKESDDMKKFLDDIRK